MSFLRNVWAWVRALSPKAQTALWFTLAVFFSTIVRLNIEKWAEDRGFDRIFLLKPPGWLISIWEHLTGPFGLGFVLGALIFAFWDPIARKLRGAKSSAPNSQASAQPPESKLSSRERFRLARRRLEEQAMGAAGETGVAKYRERSNLSELAITHGDAAYRIPISSATGTAVYAYDHDSSIKSLVALFDLRRGDLIDLRTLKPARDTIVLTIGQRAIAFCDDGTVIQILLTGVLDVGAGDDRDEAQFRYLIHSSGDFLVPAL